MNLLSWESDYLMNQQEEQIQLFFISIIMMLIIQSEKLEMTVFSFIRLFFKNKINITIKTSCLAIIILGMSGTNILFGDMKAKMKTRSYGMLLMELAGKFNNGQAIGCTLENGVLLLTQKPLSLIEPNLFN